MPTEILMPALSPTMEEGKLAKWLVKEGQQVRAGDIIAEIETDKATMEVEAVDEGKVSKLLVAEGTEGVKVNTPIALLDGEGGAPQAMSATRSPPPGGGTPKADVLRSPPPQPSPARGEGDAALLAAETVAGTETVTQTMREALRDAMAEEMRRDPAVFL